MRPRTQPPASHQRYEPSHAQRQSPNAADMNDANHFQRQNHRSGPYSMKLVRFDLCLLLRGWHHLPNFTRSKLVYTQLPAYTQTLVHGRGRNEGDENSIRKTKAPIIITTRLRLRSHGKPEARAVEQVRILEPAAPWTNDIAISKLSPPGFHCSHTGSPATSRNHTQCR